MEPITVKVINPQVKRHHKLKMLWWEGRLGEQPSLELGRGEPGKEDALRVWYRTGQSSSNPAVPSS